ncbi:MAG: response regulator transcription factor [Anaerolineae bacterium]|nr:response regulator transcription factor [Anaerolineae bacterium]NUQ05188.1 response regulator transcription factor [Anaerolineae bacterium]
MPSILLIERHGEFSNDLKKRYEVTSVPNGKQAASALLDCYFDVVILDSISLRTPGERTARALKQQLNDTPLIHLYPGAKSDAASAADIVLVPPFSARKINNAIARLLTKPDSGGEVLECGPWGLNVERRLLITASGQEVSLTPKLARLLEVFFHHPGETLHRRTLMEKVWQTDYLGDTRTLDVHVRWIRRAIEQDASSPRYLMTVRGVGYRLEAPTLLPQTISLVEFALPQP